MAKNVAVKEEVKEEAVEFVREDAIKVAEVLNEILGLEGDDVIDVEAEDDVLQEAIGKAAGLIGMDPKTNAFSAKLAAKDKEDLGTETWEYLEKFKLLGHIPEEKEDKSAEKGKKDKPKKEKDPNAPKRQAPKREGPRTALGCFEGTQAGFMDELFLKGTTEEAAIAAFDKEFSSGAAKAKARFKSHLKHLEDKAGVEIVLDKKGAYTAKVTK